MPPWVCAGLPCLTAVGTCCASGGGAGASWTCLLATLLVGVSGLGCSKNVPPSLQPQSMPLGALDTFRQGQLDPHHLACTALAWCADQCTPGTRAPLHCGCQAHVPPAAASSSSSLAVLSVLQHARASPAGFGEHEAQVDASRGKRSPAPAGEAAGRLGLLAAAARAHEGQAAEPGAEEAGQGPEALESSSRSFEMGFMLERMPLDTFCAVRAASCLPACGLAASAGRLCAAAASP